MLHSRSAGAPGITRGGGGTKVRWGGVNALIFTHSLITTMDEE